MQRAAALLTSADPSLIDSFRSVIAKITDLRFEVASSLEEAAAWFDDPALAVLFFHLTPSGAPDGVLAVRPLLDRREVPVLVVADEDRALTTLTLLKARIETLHRPLDLNRLHYCLNSLTVMKRFELKAAPAQPAATPSSVQTAGMDQTFLFHLDEMGGMMDKVRRVAPQRTTILLTGETGTGKTRMAKLIHDLSDRRNEPFMTVHCGALSDNLIESELFGHQKGSFTGADRDRKGKFAEVGKGTLLLDDVDVLPLSSQVKLLRAVEERVYEPVGSNKTQAVEARLITATNLTLKSEVQAKKFREDLFYRLSVLQFHLPPLRQRPKMIDDLARKFVKEFAEMNGRTDVQGVTTDALVALRGYQWPGNIRELRNVIEGAVALCPGPQVERDDFPEMIADQGRAGASDISSYGGSSYGHSSQGAGASSLSWPMPTQAPGGSSLLPGASGASGSPLPGNGAGPPVGPVHPGTLGAAKDQAELDAILRALEHAGNNRSKAAQNLGVSRATLYKKLKQFGLLKPGEDPV